MVGEDGIDTTDLRRGSLSLAGALQLSYSPKRESPARLFAVQGFVVTGLGLPEGLTVNGTCACRA